MRKREFSNQLTSKDRLDITLFWDKGKMVKFALNYRAKIKGEWHEVYCVDTAHNYLHEQRYWITPKPIKLSKYEPVKIIFDRIGKYILSYATQNF